MKITGIKEAGCNNTLLWALKNKATIFGDEPLCSLINDELFYIVTFSDVNSFELFRLTQIYREKLKILRENQAEIPSREILAEMFPGSITVDNKEEGSEETTKNIPKLEVAEHAASMFYNLALQMFSDNDIITEGAGRMFLPMLARRYDIQIPISFMDFVLSIKDETEAAKIFNESYPSNLTEQIIENELSSVKIRLDMAFVRSTSIIKYDERYNQLLKLVKYDPLKKGITNRLYKFSPLGFTKYDNIGRGQLRCNFFNADKDVTAKTMKQMASTRTPLKLEFMVQLPIEYMQILENYFSRDEIDIMYESSMADIIDGGLTYDDFVSPVWDLESTDEDDVVKTKNYNNAISAYNQRINEANQITLNSITLILGSNDEFVDITSTFAMLPSIYTTKALLVLNMENATKYTNISDPLLSDMLQEMVNFGENIEKELQELRK